MMVNHPPLAQCYQSNLDFSNQPKCKYQRTKEDKGSPVFIEQGYVFDIVRCCPFKAISISEGLIIALAREP